MKSGYESFTFEHKIPLMFIRSVCKTCYMLLFHTHSHTDSGDRWAYKMFTWSKDVMKAIFIKKNDKYSSEWNPRKDGKKCCVAIRIHSLIPSSCCCCCFFGLSAFSTKHACKIIEHQHVSFSLNFSFRIWYAGLYKGGRQHFTFLMQAWESHL